MAFSLADCYALHVSLWQGLMSSFMPRVFFKCLCHLNMALTNANGAVVSDVLYSTLGQFHAFKIAYFWPVLCVLRDIGTLEVSSSPEHYFWEFDCVFCIFISYKATNQTFNIALHQNTGCVDVICVVVWYVIIWISIVWMLKISKFKMYYKLCNVLDWVLTFLVEYNHSLSCFIL